MGEADAFTDTLRLELQEYGGMLDLLGKQQRGIIDRDPESLLEMNLSLELQAEVCQAARKKRESFVRSAAGRFGLGDDIKANELIPHFAEEFRPLLQALIEEIERLIETIQNRARQNHMLLSRACELNQELLHWLNPGASTTTYTKQGKHLGGPPATGLRFHNSA